MRQFTVSELKNHLQDCDESPLLLDVREPWEYDICRIEGSLLMPMGDVRSDFTRLDPDRETVVICHHGIRSMAVARFLEQMDFPMVINLAGGVNAWAREIDPKMPVY